MAASSSGGPITSYSAAAQVQRSVEVNANVDSLSNLTPSVGTLSPTFASGITAYTASVPAGTGSMTVTPTATDTKAAVTVNGLVPGAITLKAGPNTITIVVTAQDKVTAQTYTLTVTVPPSLATTLAIPSKTVTAGSPITAFTPVTASGGNGTLSYALTGGALPSGLTFSSSTGEITGTPTASLAATSFKVTASDQSKPTAEASFQTFSLTVDAAAQAALAATATPATLALKGTSKLTAAGGSGTGALTFAVTQGASLCSIGADGVMLTGNAAGDCIVTATKGADATYAAATATVSLTVNPAVNVCVEISSSDVIQGAPVTFTATVSSICTITGQADPLPGQLSTTRQARLFGGEFERTALSANSNATSLLPMPGGTMVANLGPGAWPPVEPPSPAP